MNVNLKLVTFLSIPGISLLCYYISKLLDIITQLELTVLQLEKKNAVLEVAKVASEKTSCLLASQLKINEVTSLSQGPDLHYYLITGGFAITFLICTYFGLSNQAFAKKIAVTQIEHNGEMSAKVVGLITENIVKTLTEPKGTLTASFLNQQENLNTVSTLLSKTLEFNRNSILVKLETLSLQSKTVIESLKPILANEPGLILPNINSIGIGSDLLPVLSNII